MKSAIIFLFLLLFVNRLAAVEKGGVTVGATRVIYDGEKEEARLSVSNSVSNAYLIQSWVEGGDDTVPFIITPPLFRLDGNQQNTLRVIKTGEVTHEDRESLYWLNIKCIPSSPKKQTENTLQIAVKTRIKLIYRPKAVNGISEDVANKLTWEKSGNILTVTNPTPYVMSFRKVLIGGKDIPNATYVMPMSKASFVVPKNVSGSISWSIINDYGGEGTLWSTKTR